VKTLRSPVIPLIAIIVVLLAGCEVYIYGNIDAFKLESARYQSEYTYNGTSVICDDRTTELEIVLRYRGDIEHVEIGLVGEDFGGRESLLSFSPRTSENENGEIRRTFNVRSRLSPLGVSAVSSEEGVFGQTGEMFAPRSIIVVPVYPTVIGYTSIEARVESAVQDITLTSQEIPVLDFCN
jgi:hypothetical protein